MPKSAAMQVAAASRAECSIVGPIAGDVARPACGIAVRLELESGLHHLIAALQPS